MNLSYQDDCVQYLMTEGLIRPSLIMNTQTTVAGDIKPLLRMGLDSGGEDLITVAYTSGDTADIKAGQLFTLSGGVLYWPEGANYSIEGTLGYKFDKANASNGTVEFTRIPIDIIASYVTGSHRIGGGITYHLNPTLTCDIASVCSGDVSFSNAFGVLVQYAYGFGAPGGSMFELGARYTSIEYELDNGTTVDGSAPGIFMGYMF